MTEHIKSSISKAATGTRHLILTAAFTALSAILSLIKLPGPVGSIAFDSLPGFFVAAYESPFLGGLVGFAGHIASSATVGFPLKTQHFIIAIGMFVACYCYGFIIRKLNRTWAIWVALPIGVGINSAIPYFCAIFGLDWAIVMAVKFIIPVAAFFNILVAGLLVRLVAKMRTPGI